MIAALARRQWGMVSRAQLAAVGLGRRAIGHRLEIGRLHRVHRGVYAVGHRPHPNESRWMAAELAVDGAVLSHRSAAALWELRFLTAARIEVTVDRQESRGNCRPPRSAPGR
jgi:predicted transcriptional regulator of viral defense system